MWLRRCRAPASGSWQSRRPGLLGSAAASDAHPVTASPEGVIPFDPGSCPSWLPRLRISGGPDVALRRATNRLEDVRQSGARDVLRSPPAVALRLDAWLPRNRAERRTA